MSEKEKKTYSREEYIYLSKLYEKAERFPDMIDAINKFVEMNPKLTKEERNILSAGYKNIISDKRSSWRLLRNMEKREEKKNSPEVPHIKEIKKHIEDELTKICGDIQEIIDKYLLPNAEDPENKAYYLKLKGDYYRYICEFSTDKTFEEFSTKAEDNYRQAYEIANKDLPINNATRIGLALNFAVFYYEVKDMKKEGCNIARIAFDESMKCLEEIEKSKSKDTILLIQLLKENLIFWNDEMNDGEEN